MILIFVQLIMKELEAAGWKKYQQKSVSNGVSEMDIKAVFKMVDVDKSGSISRRVRYNKINYILINIKIWFHPKFFY